MSSQSLSKCGAAKRLLKCFCGCSDMTEEDVQRIYRLSAQATLIDRQAAQMLRSFLKLQQQGDLSEIQQYLDVYEKCNEYLQTLLMDETSGILTLDELDELSELGLPYHLEKEMKKQIKTGDRGCIERGLLRIQGEMRNEIEASSEYALYKKAVLDKLKQRVN